ncbi:MAG: GNAT family protein [Pseudomonadota bacterium]
MAELWDSGGNSMPGVAVKDLSQWRGAEAPAGAVLEGRFVRCEPFRPGAHAAQLFDACSGREDLWTYMPWGPFQSAASFHKQMTALTSDPGWHYYAICDRETGKCLGKAAYLRIAPEQGSIEVGGITYAPALQRSPLATEAMVLMMRWAFAHGYRRYEWKCNAQNLASRRAAQRLGFSYEGVFRQHMVVKGKNRDTAWFAVTDGDWPALSEAYDFWLSETNIGADGTQRERLSDLTKLVRVSSDPALEG